MTTPFVPLHTGDSACVTATKGGQQAWVRPDDIASVEIDAVCPRGQQTNSCTVRVTLSQTANGKVFEFVFAAPDDDAHEAHAAAEAHAARLLQACNPQPT